MRPLTFCGWCGGPLEELGSEEGARCGVCDRSWYQNPSPTVGAAIVRDGRVLITERAREPEKGRYDVPGGFLNAGEDPVAGLRREIKEELNVEIETSVDDIISAAPHEYGEQGDWTLALGFKARLIGGEPVPADDVASVRWVEESELDQIDWAWPHDRDLARKALNGDRR